MQRAARVVCLVASVCLVAPSLWAQARQAERLMKELTRSRDAGERAEAAWDLGQMGATEAIPLLAEALQDQASSVRANAAAALWKMADSAGSAEPALRAALGDPYPGVVANAAGALRSLGVPFDELEPAYRGLLVAERCRHRNQGVRGLLGKVPPVELFRTAFECAESDDFDDRSDALKHLRQLLKTEDRALVPLVLDALRRAPEHSVSILSSAIVEYDPAVEEAVPVLEALLRAPGPEARKAGARGLGRMGDAATPAVPSLVESLAADPEPSVRETAAKAIGDLEASGSAAVPALMEAARSDPWPAVRAAAMSALGEMRGAARDAIPLLDAALEDPDPSIRIAARNALFRVDPDNAARAADKADRPPASAAAVSSRLHEDVTGLKEALVARVPVVYEVIVYPDFAMASAPEPSASGGVGSFTLRDGAVTGPAVGRATCSETFRLADVDFSILPKVVREAPVKAGAPDAEVSHVTLGRGVFCKKVGWWVGVQGRKNGIVEFGVDGKFADAKVY